MFILLCVYTSNTVFASSIVQTTTLQPYCTWQWIDKNTITCTKELDILKDQVVDFLWTQMEVRKKLWYQEKNRVARTIQKRAEEKATTYAKDAFDSPSTNIINPQAFKKHFIFSLVAHYFDSLANEYIVFDGCAPLQEYIATADTDNDGIPDKDGRQKTLWKYLDQELNETKYFEWCLAQDESIFVFFYTPSEQGCSTIYRYNLITWVVENIPLDGTTYCGWTFWNRSWKKMYFDGVTSWATQDMNWKEQEYNWYTHSILQ
jgi:hypothetical protein